MLHSANYSLGIAVFRKMLEQFGSMLKESFDVEVVEKHHNQKADAPAVRRNCWCKRWIPKGSCGLSQAGRDVRQTRGR